MRVLFVSDSHLGFDAVARARVQRRRRCEDFLACYRRALEPALAGQVDAVVHGGDVFDHPDVSAGTVDDAFAPLREVADLGCPVFVVAGNHERSRMPCPLLTMHPGVHVLTEPRTHVVQCGGLTLAVGGFAYARRVRARFSRLVEQSGLLRSRADVRLLCVHHGFEGAVVSNPRGDYVFRGAPDVIRAAEVPGEVAAVLSGHIHRHQVLTTDLAGRGLAAPVCFPGSVERTSLVEREETKGYLLLDLAAGAGGGALQSWTFRALPARPMRLHHLQGGDRRALDGELRRVIAATPADAVLHFRARAALRDQGPILSAARLRALAPKTMNVTMSFEATSVEAMSAQATPAEATPAEATPAEATPAEAAAAEAAAVGPSRRELRRAVHARR